MDIENRKPEILEKKDASQSKKISKSIVRVIITFSLSFVSIIALNEESFAHDRTSKNNKENLATQAKEEMHSFQSEKKTNSHYHSSNIISQNNDLVFDDYLTKYSGLYVLNGFPSLIVPFYDTGDGKDYLMSYLDLNFTTKKSFSSIENLANTIDGTKERKHIFPDTPGLIENVKYYINNPLEKNEQMRVVFSGLFGVTNMTPWKWVKGEDGLLHKNPIEDFQYEEIISLMKSEFDKLDDNSSSYLKLREISELLIISNRLARGLALVKDKNVTETDIQNAVNSLKFKDYVRTLGEYFNEVVSKIKSNEAPREEVVIISNLLFDLERDLVSFKNEVIKRQMLTGPIRDFIEESFKVTLDTSMQVSKALGPISESRNIQELRDYLVRAPYKIEMAGYLADTFRVASNVSRDGSISFSAKELTNIAQSTYANARAITTKYSNQDLYLPANYNAVASLDRAMTAFSTAMNVDHFNVVEANASVEKNLSALLARVEKNKFKWTDADLKEFRTMYNNANGSPQAEQKFLSVVKSYISVKDARIERSKEPEQVEAALMPHYVEGENGIEETTTYLAYKYKMVYTIKNIFPMEVTGELHPSTKEMTINTSPKERIGFFRADAQGEKSVYFTGYQVIESSQELTQPITVPPTYKIILTMADFQKIGSMQ